MEFTRRRVLPRGMHRGCLNLPAFSYGNERLLFQNSCWASRHPCSRARAGHLCVENCTMRGALLLATLANHRQSRYSHAAMLGGVLAYAVLLCFCLRILFHSVHCRVGNDAGNRNRMAHMIAELYGVACDLPSRAFRRSKLELIGV